MPAVDIRFGTDGWRGVIAEQFTFGNVRRVAQATADLWNSSPGGGGTRSAIVGYDNRFLSETYARIVCEVLAGNGIRALYPPVPTPTPAISQAVRDLGLCGAAMITASHNPPQFNGFKLKAEYAGSAEPELCAQVEARVDAHPARFIPFEEGLRRGSIEIHDPVPGHLGALRRLVDLPGIRRARRRVVVDSMHGCGGSMLERFLAGGRLDVRTIRAGRDPLFGGANPEPIAANLRLLGRTVCAAGADIGLATDGDADRLGVVDERGRYLSIQLVIAVLLQHVIRRGPQPPRGTVVRSTNGTVLVDRICRKYALPLAEVPVGFKHICAKMRETDVLLGGEESGGIGFRGHIPERDGILACLMWLDLLATCTRTVSQIVDDLQREFGRSCYDRRDLTYPLSRRDALIESVRRAPPASLDGSPVVSVNDSDGVKLVAADDSWLMFRASGTEPIVRIYAEAASAARVRRLLECGGRIAAEFSQG